MVHWFWHVLSLTDWLIAECQWKQWGTKAVDGEWRQWITDSTYRKTSRTSKVFHWSSQKAIFYLRVLLKYSTKPPWFRTGSFQHLSHEVDLSVRCPLAPVYTHRYVGEECHDLARRSTSWETMVLAMTRNLFPSNRMFQAASRKEHLCRLEAFDRADICGLVDGPRVIGSVECNEEEHSTRNTGRLPQVKLETSLTHATRHV